ncbi:hypothetical protein CCYA_CCYA06G1919 [Cyanidiococcus yangmingshanensis]|nr:hypothetical protein CCYA_CCYA06G1919 [Cyanidiococcus yangmingshanensis]
MLQALLLARVVGGLFSLLALTLSLQNIWLHLRHYVRPEYQLYICRILGMVPVYSLSSWLSLLLPDKALYFDLVRDSYEAYTLYSFVALLINVAGGERSLAYLLELKPPLPHPWPMGWFRRPEPLGARFLKKVRLAMLQFVFLKPLTAAVAVALNRHGWYVQPKSPDARPIWFYGYPYIWIVVNLSVSLALYWMVMLYLATEDLLQAFRPLPKFLCVKAVIFFSWWQGVVLGLLVQWHWLTDVGDFSSDSVATGIQDLLICSEMFLAAIIHHYVFSSRDFEDYAPDPSRPVLRNFGDLVDIRDMLSDAKNALYGTRYERELRDREPMIPEPGPVLDEYWRHSSLDVLQTMQAMNKSESSLVEVPDRARTARALREAAKQQRWTDTRSRRERPLDVAAPSIRSASPDLRSLQ